MIDLGRVLRIVHAPLGNRAVLAGIVEQADALRVGSCAKRLAETTGQCRYIGQMIL
jgi:hypothetical protein